MTSSIFILYTGGTFGMKKTKKGLVPSSWDEIINYLPAIKNQNYFDSFNKIEFRYDTLNPVVDSSDMNPESWNRIAKIIYKNYDDYHGFIIIHGTDTLAYTASALSFMFNNLDKPIVLTGSQLPIFHPRTDGIVNLSNAIYIAGHKTFNIDCIPEVCICFNDDVLRGNRSIKVSTNDFEGFSSPNFENLANLEQKITLNHTLINKKNNNKVVLKPNFSDNVVNVTVFPGYNPSALISIVKNQKIEGIVLKTFGAGNLPKNSQWQKLIKACEKNKTIIFATTQCPNGKIEIGKYASSATLQSTCVVSGKDITSEAALTKLMWVIGNYSYKERHDILRQNIRGEMT
ncbi:MAG: asparaginase [Bacteroidia bacterium]|nr:asparaginase [Bacteroidia bacterium]